MAPNERISFDVVAKLRKNLVLEVHRERQLCGKVISFNGQTGYGFIDCSGFEEDIFVHYTAIRNMPPGHAVLNNNDNVEFNVIKTPKGWQAKHLIRKDD